LSDKKKILVFIDWFLPGYKAGGPIQSCANLIAHLKNDFDFSVITRDTDYCETLSYPNIKSDEWNVLPDGTRVYYISKNNLNKKTIENLIATERFDTAYLNGIYSFYFSLLPLYFLKSKIKNQKSKIIIAARGMLANSAIAVKKTKKKFFIFISKQIGLFNNVLFHATTAEEARDIKNIFTNAEIKIAPNLPKKTAKIELVKRNKTVGTVRLINIARISPEKNLKYALEILSKVKSKVEFDFYGPIYNEEYWNECKSIIAAMPENIKVSYKNSIVPEKIISTFSDYHFMLMPTRGENFGHIILEAMSSGCPVVISDQTPWKDLENKKIGWDIPLSNPEKFIKTIEKTTVLTQEEYNQWSKSAYNFAQTIINNKEAVEQNKNLFFGTD